MQSERKKIRVLVVDDSALMRKLIPQILATDSSIQVVGTAEDEASALRWLGENVCDLAIVDIFLKSGSGLGVLKTASLSGESLVHAEHPAGPAR